MSKKKVEKLNESQVHKTYEVLIGFNTSDGKRYDVGERKPNFVYEKDFEKEDWKALVQMDAVGLAVEPEKLGKDETIVFEVIK